MKLVKFAEYLIDTGRTQYDARVNYICQAIFARDIASKCGVLKDKRKVQRAMHAFLIEARRIKCLKPL